MKKFALSAVVSLASLIAYVGILPTCWSTLYQPEVPEELIR